MSIQKCNILHDNTQQSKDIHPIYFDFKFSRYISRCGMIALRQFFVKDQMTQKLQTKGNRTVYNNEQKS